MVDLPGSLSDRSTPLQRAVGLILGAVAAGLAVFNFLGSPNRDALSLTARLLEPQVSLVVLIGGGAFATVFVPRLRVLQVILLAATGLGSAIGATPSDQTPFVWLLLAMLLAHEYRMFARYGRVKAAAAIGAFLVIRLVSIVTHTDQELTRIPASIGTAAVIGVFAWLLIIDKQRDAARRHGELEEAVAASTRDLADALADQRLLHAELHHRTKNNLQLVSSMLSFDSEPEADDPHAKRIRASEARIQALARVHELLYTSSTGHGEVDLAPFVDDYLRDAELMVRDQGIEFDRTVAVVGRVPTDFAIRFAIILNEIVMNASDPGAASARELESTRRVTIDLHDEGQMLVLETRQPGARVRDEARSRVGLGVQLIESMVVRLGGTSRYTNDAGARWEIRLPLDGTEWTWRGR